MRGTGKRVCLALLLGSISLAVSAQQSKEDTAGEPSLDCAVLADQKADQAASRTGEEWLRRSLWASHCLIFQARALRVGVDGVRTLALSHSVRDGVEREEVHFLDGEPVVIERQGTLAAVGGRSASSLSTTLPDAVVQHLDGRYRLRVAGKDRIAGRTVVRVDVEPLDDFRYGRQLWLDTETALPLKQVLLDERLRALETFQMIELSEPQLYQGSVVFNAGSLPVADEWQPDWLPPGFEIQSVISGAATSNIAHHLYGDGLATLSLFVEPLSGQPSLKPGLHRLGVSQAVVLQRNINGQQYQVMAMGELPPETLSRVAQGVEWSDWEGAGSEKGKNRK